MNKVVVIALRHPSEPNLFLHGLRRDNGKWTLAGGHAAPGETTHESATRELREETGLDGVQIEPAHHDTYGDVHVHLFVGQHPGTDHDASSDPDHEFVTFKFLDPTEHGNLHIPRDRNILVDWMRRTTGKTPKPDVTPPGFESTIYKNDEADAETEKIRENKKKPENMVAHDFKAARWTHPNGHPRCIRCGDEERIGGVCHPSVEKTRGRFVVEPFTADPESFNPRKHDFVVHLMSGKNKIGFVAVTHRPEGIMPFNLEVGKKFRRKGFASTLLKYAQKISGKKAVRSPDMTPDAKAFADSFFAPKIKKADVESFMEQFGIVAKSNYAQRAMNTTILLYPISIGGKRTRQDGLPFHMTVKSFGPTDQANQDEVKSIVDQHRFSDPVDPHKMLFMPHVLKGIDGAEHHVLLVYGAPHKVKQLRESTEHMGPNYKNFLPHIGIDREDWDRLSRVGKALTAKEAGITFHPAELKAGMTVLKTY